MLTQNKNSFKALASDPRYITTLQTTGNKKLLDTETIQNMRWNLPARTTCPYATPHCFNSCYAFRDERYTNVKQSRALSLDYANDRNFARNMIYSIESNLSRPCFKGKKVYFRIHESGDFYSLAYTKKWLQVIKHFEGNQNLVFVAYTKSIDYFIKLGLDSSDAIARNYPNFILSLSLWDDTPDDIKALAGRFKTYTALYPEEIQTRKREEKETFHHCKCSGCGSTCRACMTYRIKNTAVAIH